MKRQNASTFNRESLKKIGYNLGGVVFISLLGRSLWDSFPSFFHPGKALHPYASWTYYILHLLFVFNIIYAMFPLWRKKDDLSDIALTPAQRQLLGLPPSSAPPTPGSQYATPPRYARTPTPLSGSPASKKGTYSNSPLSGKGSPRSPSAGSPFSPNASPFLSKAMGAGNGSNRRHSYGSGSPLGPGASRGGVADPGTPTPSATKGSGIGLNSKWLYDKGRRNSGTRLYT